MDNQINLYRNYLYPRHKFKRHIRENTDMAFLFYMFAPYTLFIQHIMQIANTTNMQTHIGYSR